jgi:exosortase/archaeosortase family protein
MHPLIMAVLVVAATWDSWRWYLARVASAPEDAATLVVAALFLGALGVARRDQAETLRSVPLWTVVCLLVAYAIGCFVLPPIGRAAIAIAATLFVIHTAVFKDRPPFAFWGLIALALPVLPSLQFMLGYPLRSASAAATVVLLRAHGFIVERQGTLLAWRDELIQFDAACSGVNMLWASMMLTLMGCILFRLRALQVLVASVSTVVFVVVTNVLRTASLFYLESGFIPQAAGWWHEAVGVAAFMLSAGMIVWLLRWLRDGEAAAWAR